MVFCHCVSHFTVTSALSAALKMNKRALATSTLSYLIGSVYNGDVDVCDYLFELIQLIQQCS